MATGLPLYLNNKISNGNLKNKRRRESNQILPPSTQKFTVSTTQFGVGAAYYFFPIAQKWNVSANPYLVTERKFDPVDTENNMGVGLKADALYLINSLALGAGLHAGSVSGDTTTSVNAGVGYMF